MSYFAAPTPIYNEADPPNSGLLLAGAPPNAKQQQTAERGTGQVTPMSPRQGTTAMRRTACSAGGEGAVIPMFIGGYSVRH